MDPSVSLARRIDFLITTIDLGGAERQVVQLATGMRARGWAPRVISLIPLPEAIEQLVTWSGPQDDPPAALRQMHALADELADAGIPIATLGMRVGVADPRASIRLALLLRQSPPAVLHSHMVHANLLARITRPLHRVPVQISTAHNVHEGGRVLDFAYRLTDPLCTLTTHVSRVGMARYIREGMTPAHKIRWVPNGVDTGRFRPDTAARTRLRRELHLTDEHFVWLATGRFVPAKDHATLIRAFAALGAAWPGGRLLLVGAGPLMEEARALVAMLGVGERVRFLGLRGDIAALMNAADAYVMSSAWEGLPMVLLEAAASGLPIVATAVGGNGEVVRDGERGLLVPPRDPAALAAGLGRLMGFSATERARFGAAGLAWVGAHRAMETITGQWEALYEALLRGHGAPR